MSFFIVRLSLFLSLPFTQSPSLAIPPHPSPFLGRFLSISLSYIPSIIHTPPLPSFLTPLFPNLSLPCFFIQRKCDTRLFLPLVDLLLCFVPVILCFLFCNKDIASSLMTERRSDRLFLCCSLVHISFWRSIPAYGRYPPAINVKQQQREGKAMQNESPRFFYPPSFSSFLPLSTKIINP
ncbi:hypothetical protein BKA57DRAFT_452639 [Linnemannia elongata]|nr:hypothetical protein BKA57DRAFT_452639 [Linnemannia elongata]